MKRIGLLYRPDGPEPQALAEDLEAAFRGQGVDVWRGSSEDQDALCAVAPDLSLLVTLGGDGTIVRAVHCVAPAGVPILGVNMGRLGFLAEVEPCKALAVVPRVLAGEYMVEERMMLHAELLRSGEAVAAGEAINDVVLARGASVRTVQVAVHVDDHYVMTQTADGVIVSSPTGSTAYCLSAGGPIVAPGIRCMVLTPIAAHLAVAHAIVVPGDVLVRLTLRKGRGATLTIDGQADAKVEEGDAVVVSASRNAARFVRFGNKGYFYETVLHRLRWHDPGQEDAAPS